jgi:hypothetical protein
MKLYPPGYYRIPIDSRFLPTNIVEVAESSKEIFRFRWITDSYFTSTEASVRRDLEPLTVEEAILLRIENR